MVGKAKRNGLVSHIHLDWSSPIDCTSIVCRCERGETSGHQSHGTPLRLHSNFRHIAAKSRTTPYSSLPPEPRRSWRGNYSNVELEAVKRPPTKNGCPCRFRSYEVCPNWIHITRSRSLERPKSKVASGRLQIPSQGAQQHFQSDQ